MCLEYLMREGEFEKKYYYLLGRWHSGVITVFKGETKAILAHLIEKDDSFIGTITYI